MPTLIEKQAERINLEIRVLQLRQITAERMNAFYETPNGLDFLAAKQELEQRRVDLDRAIAEVTELEKAEKETPKEVPDDSPIHTAN